MPFESYKEAGYRIRKNSLDPTIPGLLFRTSGIALQHLKQYEIETLISEVPEKQYFAFGDGSKISRPVNRDLFLLDWNMIPDPKDNHSFDASQIDVVNRFWNSINTPNPFDNEIDPDEVTKALYLLVISLACYVDLVKKGDQKTPGTFFEYVINSFFSTILKISPSRSIPVLNLDRETSLPTDYIFDLGKDKAKIHLPVKTSTRERGIQVWAHQRVLDGVYGAGRFLGMLVCLAETKLSLRDKIVTEICLPDQWRLYQMFIARMETIYYLDIPYKYEQLNSVFPPLKVKPLGSLFQDLKTLI